MLWQYNKRPGFINSLPQIFLDKNNFEKQNKSQINNLSNRICHFIIKIACQKTSEKTSHDTIYLI